MDHVTNLNLNHPETTILRVSRLNRSGSIHESPIRKQFSNLKNVKMLVSFMFSFCGDILEFISSKQDFRRVEKSIGLCYSFWIGMPLSVQQIRFRIGLQSVDVQVNKTMFNLI